MLEKLKNYFKSKALGFYFTAAVVVLSFLQLIVYIAAFTPVSWESYMPLDGHILFGIGNHIGAGLSVLKMTSPWAPVAATLMEFLSLLMFVRYGYMYFSQIFFGGFSFALVFQMYYGYLVSIILYILILGLGTASIFFKQTKAVENCKTENEAVAPAGCEV